MIPRTFPSTYLTANGKQQMSVYFLSSVDGLQRWKDYIPVRSSSEYTVKENSYDNDGVILIKDIGSTYGKQEWKDYIPVYLDLNATDAWEVDAVGFIPTFPTPGLSLDFTSSSETLDPRITFSRASNATRVNSDGLIEYAPHNLLTFSEQFDNAAWGKANSTVTANATTAPNNTATADNLIANTTNGEHNIDSGSVAIVSGNNYTFSCYVKDSGVSSVGLRFTVGANWTGGVSPQISLSFSTGLTTVIAGTIVAHGATAVGNGWYRVFMTVLSAGTGNSAARIHLMSGTSNIFAGNDVNGVYIWGAQLNVGALQPYYPTTVKNLLGFSESFENAAWTKSNSYIQTNLATQSEDFTAWTSSNVSVTANSTSSPINTITADTVNEGTGAGVSHRALSPITFAFTSGVAYTFSLYVKNIDRNFVQIASGSSAFGANAFANFDVSTGVVGTVGSSATATITNVGNGWYRCSMTATASSTTSDSVFVAMITASNSARNESYTGTNKQVYIWGAQLVQGSTAGDYQQTTSAATPVMYQAPNGTMTADKLVETTANDNHVIVQAFSSLTGGKYTGSFRAKAGERNQARIVIFDGSTTFAAYFDLLNGTVGSLLGAITANIQPLGDGWYLCSGTITSTATSSSANMAIRVALAGSTIYTGDGTSGILIWGAQLSDSASLDTYVANPGAAPTSTAYYGPRFTYDPVTKAPLGLLIEEQRTNLLLNSDTLATQNVTVAATAYTLSFYGTGTVTLSGVSTAGPVVGTGAYPERVTLNFTPTAGTLTLTVTGSVRLAQLEAGAFATSYIPTTTASATRSADIATVTGSNFASWYNTDEGTLFAEFQRFYVAGGYFPRVFSLGNSGSNNELIEFVYSSPSEQFTLVSNNVGQGPIALADGGTAMNKLSGGYKINDVAASLNGGAVSTDTTSVVPVVSQMRIGDRQDAQRPFSGTIKRIAYIPTRLSNQQLQNLTS